MHIAYDARELRQTPRGIGVYLMHVVDHFISRGHRITLLSDGPLVWRPAIRSARFRVVTRRGPETGSWRLNRIVWQETVLPRMLSRICPDVFHAVANQGIPADTGIPSVLTIHDLIPVVMPKDVEQRYYYQFVDSLAINRADWIVTISKYSERDLYRIFPEAKNKTTVIYNGMDALEVAPGNPFGRYQPYVTYSGTFERRKNVDVLVRGFAKFVRKRNHHHFRLLLPGAKDNEYRRLREIASELGIANRIKFLGYVTRAELGSLFQDAFCMVFPSRYEGFGLPPLEAMSVGCPVIVAKNTSLPEAVGRAGLYVPTGSVIAVSEALQKLAHNEGNRQRLVKAGYRQVKHFSWDRNVTALLRIYQNLLRSR